MSKWKEKLARFMTGRYGMDELGKVTLYGSLIFLLVSLLFHWDLFYLLAIASLVICYGRMLSKNYTKRYGENQKYLNFRYRLICRLKGIRKQGPSDPDHKIFSCPNCRQKVRVPKGKGKIAIRCPKCGTEFVKRT